MLRSGRGPVVAGGGDVDATGDAEASEVFV